jgi:hypothetical protein
MKMQLLKLKGYEYIVKLMITMPWVYSTTLLP